MRRLVTFTCCLLLVFGCARATRVSAGSFFAGLPVDGIPCQAQEQVFEHIHSNLQLFDRGHQVVLPSQIGIPPGAGCLYWLHTHATDGFIHVESPVKRTFKLGEFFDIWQQPLSWSRAASLRAPRGRRLSIWVNGHPWHGANPRDIVLRDHETIVIQNGPPFAAPKPVDWNMV
ncbi:MAG: hypothetical protein ACYDHD_09875 [Vulcanimicrobiaceae bacterium]